MTEARHLNNAPIVEALIDFRVVLPDGFDPQKFVDLKNELGSRYPKNEARKLLVGSFGISSGKFEQQAEDKGIQGYVFKSEDEKDIAQFRIDGFTFSRLNPYSDWKTVLSEASRLWELYRAFSSPIIVNRLAARYINRLDFKIPIDDYSIYLTAPPAIPESLPHKMSSFLTRLVLHDDGLTANVIQAMTNSPKEGFIGVVLDIDVFEAQEAGFPEDSISKIFEKIRLLKNKIFFGSITENTIRIYE